MLFRKPQTCDTLARRLAARCWAYHSGMERSARKVWTDTTCASACIHACMHACMHGPRRACMVPRYAWRLVPMSARALHSRTGEGSHGVTHPSTPRRNCPPQHGVTVQPSTRKCPPQHGVTVQPSTRNCPPQHGVTVHPSTSLAMADWQCMAVPEALAL
eukprot:355619-Chlamydomonas_euryale.AAC.2